MKIWRKLLICSVSLIVFFFAEIAINIACGGEGDPYDYYVSFFHNDIQRTQEYKPFYFTSYSFLYDDEEQVSEATLNSREWAAYLGHGVKTEDVEKAMYNLKYNADSTLYNGYLDGKGPLPDSLKSNTFLQALASNKSALSYYQFAKGVEPVANVKSEYWNPKEMDTKALKEDGEEALSNANTQKDKFIKLRYLYQAQRLLHYGKYYKEAADVYDKYLVNYKTDSHVKGWTLALRAGESRWLGDTVNSAYLFSKIFAAYPERRVQAYRNFNYMRVKTAAVLALAANKNEKAVIHAIDGFNDPALNINPLKEVYEYEPSSDMVGVLLIREINKLEEQYVSTTLTPSPAVSSYYQTMPDSSKNKALAHIKQLESFCQKLSAEKKYPESSLGNLALAYLAWMQKDTKSGLGYLAALNSEKLSSKFNDQKQIIQLLLTAQGIQQYNEVNEATLLPSLKWLDDKVAHEIKNNTAYNLGYYGLSPFAITARNFYQDIMAPAYLKQGDSSKAAIAMLQGDASGSNVTEASSETINYWQNYLHSSALNKIIAWKKTPPANPYLHFLTQKLGRYSNGDLYELLGTAYLREHKYAEAANALKIVNNKKLSAFPTNFYDEKATGSDPFISQMPDYPKLLLNNNEKGYNKRQFAQAMAGFQKQIKADPKNASAYYFTMGTALYNTSTYGNAWYLISYNWSSTDYGRKSLYYYDADYIKTTNAEKYFLKARQLSTNAEFKAKCTFMAAKCRQKQIKLPSYSDYRDYNYTKLQDDEKNYDKAVRRNPYFAELQKSYGKTAYYKLAVNDCSYLRDFLKVSKK
ncbi:hypothetical protein SAMN05421821_102315 [Mucilaginibacter lappiensis]|uniref:Tetratricopeptide repeat-containing protein n=1 Tax=Mucilaginibacter lappiensis TaxID=354630 RepID=A0ABR6PFR6_9SPHI|nr:hypothetical protein [Mucilaginibacter lappiensis]MBB6108448.1 hypothetical protein [Mucilaginibacter lappiensis]SIQ37593.1 hypothetical protein SAMN05421821_102315 [Mucilaginibacter lappiensis]